VSLSGFPPSKDGKAPVDSSYYIDERNINSKGRLEMTVEVKEMPELHVAYCRHMGSYQGVGQVFEKLMRWAGSGGKFILDICVPVKPL